MKKILYFLSFLVLISISCKDIVEEPVPVEDTEVASPREDIAATPATNIKLLGVKGDGSTDDRAAIQAAIGSNKTLFFPKGTYKISQAIDITRVSNLKIAGEEGTVFVSGNDVICYVRGAITNLEFTGITFKSTKVSTADNAEGLLTFANYGTNDVMDNLKVNNCTFTNPNTQANGIKLLSEGLNSVAKNIFITKNKFESIGRFAVEFQNHQRKSQLARFRNYEINNNYFNDCGTIQTGPAPVCISVSGYATDGKINYNEIVNMRMNTSRNIYYAVENAGTIGCETIGNRIRSNTYGFTGIMGSHPTAAEVVQNNQPFKRNWIIKDNVIELTGSTKDKNKIRGMQIENVEGYTIANNIIKTDGIGINLVNCTNGRIEKNNVVVKAGNVLYFRNGSARNVITANNLTGQSTGHSIIFFEGTASSGNTAFENTVIKPANVPYFQNYLGASNSVK